MLKIYGSMLCPDCVDCRNALDRAGIQYIFCDFQDNLLYLKEFLALRDTMPVFDEAKEQGFIGIPCLVDQTGKCILNWECYVSRG